MIEKVSPDHPDKVADRIAGALVDMACAKQENPRIAVEVLLGHGECSIIAETSVRLSVRDVWNAVRRITGNDEITVRYREYPQDEHLAENQSEGFRCGDNGVFRGCPVTEEQRKLSAIAREYRERFKSDVKYVLDGDRLVVCQGSMEHRQDDVSVSVYAYLKAHKLFGRAAIPTTTHEGVKSIIERKMKSGEISQPWEIFENLLGEKTYGARGRKAD